MDAIGKMVGLLVLVMFAVDCIVSAARSTLAWERLRRLQKNAHVLFRDKVRAQTRQTLILNALTVVLCLAAVNFTALRVGRTINADSVPPQLDVLLTSIVLIAGMDRTRDLLARFKGVVESAPARKEVPAARIVIDNENHARLREAV
ncbi:MAG: hypothetical protein DMF56_23570 [Acidobacteria bacterium]|nr:MAG: hypothetical protein DMF56_23570 [Acidobacteriota bacterium]